MNSRKFRKLIGEYVKGNQLSTYMKAQNLLLMINYTQMVEPMLNLKTVFMSTMFNTPLLMISTFTLTPFRYPVTQVNDGLHDRLVLPLHVDQ